VSHQPIQWKPEIRFGKLQSLYTQAPGVNLLGFTRDPRGLIVPRRDDATRSVALEGVLNWTRLLASR